MNVNLTVFSTNIERYIRFKIQLDGFGNGIGKSEKSPIFWNRANTLTKFQENQMCAGASADF